MFTMRRKKNYRTFLYAAIIVTLCLLIIVIAWPQEKGGQPENLHDSANANADVNAPDDDSANAGSETNPDKRDPFRDDNSSMDAGDNDSAGDYFDDEEEKSNMTGSGATYYLIKRAGDRIKVFFIDEQGNQIELETTEIIYDVLSTEDQKLFDEGYKVKNQEELAVLLQDFES